MNTANGEKLPTDGLRAIFRDGTLLFGARLVAQVSRLAYMLFVVRSLGPDLYGMLVYLHSWGLLFLPFVSMGSQDLLSRAYGRTLQNGGMLARRLWTLQLLTVPAFAVLLVALGVASEPDTSIRTLFVIVAIALMGRGFALWSSHVLIANRRADQVLVIEAVFRFGEVLVVIYALQLDVGIAGLLMIHAAAWWLQAVSSATWVGATLVRPRWVWRDLRVLHLLRQSLPVTAVGIALLFLVQGPVVLGRHVLGREAALGELALAVQLVSVFAVVSTIFGIASLPVLAGASASRVGPRYLLVIVPASAVAALALAVASALIGESVLGALFGERFAAAAPLLTLGLSVLLVPLAPAALLSRVGLASVQKGALGRAAAAALAGLGGGALAMFLGGNLWGADGLLIGAGAGALLWLVLLIAMHRYHSWEKQ